jgi:hypothetical protein
LPEKLLYLTAKRRIRITEIQMKAVRNKRSKILVLGKTTAWMPPIRIKSIRAQTRPPGKPKSTSS